MNSRVKNNLFFRFRLCLIIIRKLVVYFFFLISIRTEMQSLLLIHFSSFIFLLKGIMLCEILNIHFLDLCNNLFYIILFEN